MNYIKNIAIVIVLLLLCSCNEKKTRVVENNPVIKSEKVYDSSDIVYKAFLDSNGTMWFTTSQEGIYKYDGNHFINYSMEDGLCGNEVTSIIEDDNGDLLLGTDHGICRFNGTTFSNLSLPNYPKQSDWLDRYYPMINPSAVTVLLKDDQNHLWIGTNCAGLYEYDGIEFMAHLQEEGNTMPDGMHHNFISSLAQNDKGHLWIGSFSHGGIQQYNGKKFIKHPLKDGIGDGMISSIYIDSQERIWVGTRNAGIYTYQGGRFIPMKFKNAPEDIAMAKFFEDKDGTLWISSYARKGVFQLDGDRLIPFNIPKSDQLVDVMTMGQDKDGNLWFGGRHGLLWRYDGKHLKDFTLLKRQ